MNSFHGCDAVKRLKENEILITNENFIVNGEINKSDIIQNLSFHKKNSNILGFPLRLHIYNLAKPNKDFRDLFLVKVSNSAVALLYGNFQLSCNQT